MKFIQILVVLFLFGACKNEKPVNQLPQEAQVAATAIEKTIEGFSSPESVLSDGTYYYVSNVGEKLLPTVKDGDGYISQLNGDGTFVTQRFIDGLDAPKGMAIVGKTLYVADVDKVKGFNLGTSEKVFELDFAPEKVQFLNDLTAKPDGKLYVSSTDLGKIYEINVEENGSYQALTIEGDLAGVNGLFYDPRTSQLFTTSFGKNNEPTGQVGVINMGSKALLWKPLNDYKGALDGLSLLGSSVIFSDWNTGELVIIDLMDRSVNPITLPTKIKGPADFYYDQQQVFWIPQMQENKVLMIQKKI